MHTATVVPSSSATPQRVRDELTVVHVRDRVGRVEAVLREEPEEHVAVARAGAR